MSEYIRVKGNIIEKTGGVSRVYAKEGIEHNSNGKIEYFAESYSYGDPQPPPIKIMDGAVKEIELLTPLDQGSANDKSGNYQDGMIFGKTYHFKVKSYFQNPPINIANIKWMVKYHSPSQNKWLEIPLSAKGDSITMTMNDEDMCGRYLYVRAYVYNAEREAEYKQWKHNRFRWFDRMTFQDGLTIRKNNPEKINQHATSLCGTAALLYFYAQDYPNDFYNNYMEFFRKGEIIINKFKLSPNPALYDCKPDLNNFKYPHYDYYSNGQPCIPHQLMHQTDWIILAGTRSSDNTKYLGQKGEDWNAINWPKYMIQAALDLYGASLVADETFIITGREFSNKLLEIEKLFNQGWHIILLIDSDMLDDSISYVGCATQYHWIAYEGNLIIDPIKNEYSFSYYCWQKLNINSRIRSTVFNTNFYGYIKFKK